MTALRRWQVATIGTSLLSLILLIVVIGQSDSLNTAQQVATLAIGNNKRLQVNLEQSEADFAAYRLLNQPREFKSVDAFKVWVSQQNLTFLRGNSWESAQTLQKQAFKDGWTLGYEITQNTVSKGTEFWPIAKIGNEVYCIEPQTNNVTKFYPAEWWR